MIALSVSLLIVLPLTAAAAWMSLRARAARNRPVFEPFRDARVVVVSVTAVSTPPGVPVDDALRQWCRLEAVVTPRTGDAGPAEWVPGVLEVVDAATASRCAIHAISCFDGKSWSPAGFEPRHGSQSVRIHFAAEDGGQFRLRYAGREFGAFVFEAAEGAVAVA